MRSRRKATAAASLALAVLLVTVLAPRSAAGQGKAATRTVQAPGKASCVFTHPAFSGKCTENVDVAENSTAADACSAILDCLNSVGCVKTYCSATTLRGGWKLETASSEARP
ncbi:MAG TPA: hypothetical protein VE129_15960 [Thermoanaerobaculia bacterium]|nr:hypothetical protein [Thermoanaerobaculia bacterium]